MARLAQVKVQFKMAACVPRGGQLAWWVDALSKCLVETLVQWCQHRDVPSLWHQDFHGGNPAGGQVELLSACGHHWRQGQEVVTTQLMYTGSN